MPDQNPPAGTPNGRTQRERRAETERRVLEAAVRLIAAGGSRSMSLAQVGVEAGYSRGIVTHQFGSKDELLRRVAEYAQQVFAAPATSERGLDQVLAIVDTYLEYLVKHEPAGQAFLLMWVEAVASEASLRSIFLARDETFRRVLAEHVSEGIGEGTIRPDVDPGAAAVSIVGQLRGIGLQLMLTPDTAGFDLVRREALAMVRNGLAHPEPQPAKRRRPARRAAATG